MKVEEVQVEVEVKLVNGRMGGNVTIECVNKAKNDG